MIETTPQIVYDHELISALRLLHGHSEEAACLACGRLLLSDLHGTQVVARDFLLAVLSWRSRACRVSTPVKTLVADYIHESTLREDSNRCLLLTACDSDELIQGFETNRLPISTKVRLLGHSSLDSAHDKLSGLMQDGSRSDETRYKAALLLMRDGDAEAEVYVRRHRKADDTATEVALSGRGDRSAADALKARLERSDEMWAEAVRRASDLFTNYDGLYRDDWRQRLLEQLHF